VLALELLSVVAQVAIVQALASVLASEALEMV